MRDDDVEVMALATVTLFCCMLLVASCIPAAMRREELRCDMELKRIAATAPVTQLEEQLDAEEARCRANVERIGR